jgi:hypothetical protein
MAKRAFVPLPESLQYLQPVLNFLAKLPREQLNEDVDQSRLERALRKRLRGLDERAAVEALSTDCQELKRWLKSTAGEDHPAYWLFGALSYLSNSPDVVPQFLHTTKPPPKEPKQPTIQFDPPAGWTAKSDRSGITLKQGKLVVVIETIDELLFDACEKYDREEPPNQNRFQVPGLPVSRHVSKFRSGDVSGMKHDYRMKPPASGKRIEYVLRVPGGYVSAWLDASGADFDEVMFEAKLDTVRIAATT